MKKVCVVILLCALWYPAAGFAAVIKSTTESSADSGGNSAGSGGRVITGSERAAADSVTIGTKDGTTVEIRVATTSRGGSGDKSKATTSLLLQQSVNESLSEALSTTSPPWSSPLDVLRGFFDRVFMIFRLPL